MTIESQPAPAPTSHHYGLPNYPVTITGEEVTAVVRSWHRLSKRATVKRLSDYIAVGHRIVSRRTWLQRFPSHYRQAVLVHRNNRFGNIILGETRILLGESDVASLQLRAMLEKFGKELSFPVIDDDRPPRIKRPLMNGSPEQVFETRFPDELNLSVRELVARGRLAVSRNVPPLPRGLTIARKSGTLQLTFRYSALWETLKVIGYFLTLMVIGSAVSHHHSGTHMSGVIGLASAVTVFAFLIVFPIKYFFNGNELLLADDRWTYKPASGSLLLPSVQALSQLRLSEIEEIYRSGRDVVVGTDREIVRIRCRSRAMAKWLEQSLLAVAAYGLSVLDGVPTLDDAETPISSTNAGAGPAPAFIKVYSKNSPSL